MEAGIEQHAGSVEIKPEEGFEVVGPYGLQRCGPGVNDRLLRLDEALHWMAFKKEWPRDKSVYAVFSPLIQWDEADSPYRRQVLYLLNHEGYAYPLSLGDKLNPAAVDVWGDMSFSYGHTYSMGTVREMADVWAESWPGYVANADPFYRAGWVEYCKAMKRVAKANELPSLWEEKYREDYYINLGDWKERCQRFVRSLSRLAVPVSVAYELWGWGRAVAAVQSDVVADTAPAIEVQDVIDWPSLVRYRLQFASVAAQKRPVWLPGHVEILAARLHEEHQAGQGRGALGRLAGELRAVRSTVGELLKKHDFNQATGEKQQAPATPWSGLGGRGGKAA